MDAVGEVLLLDRHASDVFLRAVDDFRHEVRVVHVVGALVSGSRGFEHQKVVAA
jgi:hypothetical protein